MISTLIASLAAWWIAIGPNGAVLAPAIRWSEHLAMPEAVWLRAVSDLYVVTHERAAWPRAAYRPARLPTPARARAGERWLPGLAVPRLVLYAPHYRTEHGFSPVADMAVDTASALFAALVAARLDGEGRLGGEAFSASLASRAGARFEDVPEAVRSASFYGALVDYGTTALGVANEIGRSQGRRRARGDTLCRLIDHPRTLFRRWRDVFGAMPFHGIWGDGQTTRAGLSADDKAWLVRVVLGLDWTGDPRRDFAAMCPSTIEGDG